MLALGSARAGMGSWGPSARQCSQRPLVYKLTGHALAPITSGLRCDEKRHPMKKNLNTIEIFHYVYGAMLCFGGIFCLALVAMGSFLGSDWLAAQSNEPPPPWLGGFLSTLGMALFLFIETLGILVIYSGRCIAKRKNRTFSMVIAAFCCLSIPLGLILGIFTLVALSDEEVKQEYGIMPHGAIAH